jgi:hypothetical protein
MLGVLFSKCVLLIYILQSVDAYASGCFFFNMMTEILASYHMGVVCGVLASPAAPHSLTSVQEPSDACFSCPLCSFTEQTFVSIHENYE